MTTRVVVLVIDRLGAGFLGPYGNTWLDTPCFNALAAEAMTVENAIVDSPCSADACTAYWTGKHALRDRKSGDAFHLPEHLRNAGVATSLVTDEDAVAEHPLADDFGELVRVPSECAPSPAEDVEQTQLARVFSSAMDCLQRQQGDCLLWVHARGMQAAWDAPLALRRGLAAADDPTPPDDVAPPSLTLPKDYDPDLLLGLVQAYAGQVLLLDACLGALLNELRHLAGQGDTLLLFTSPRGYPLGEHLIVGDADTRLYGELLHVPMFLWRDNGALAAMRDPSLVQPADVAATLADWFSLSFKGTLWNGQSLLGLASGSKKAWRRDRAVSVWRDERSIRTPAWFLRRHSASDDAESAQLELFRKPDDRWEINEVAQLCPEIAGQLSQAIDEFELAMRTSQTVSLPPLADELIEGVE